MQYPDAPPPPALSPLAQRHLLEAPQGIVAELPRTGSALENPHVYDAVARELLRLESAGRLHVVRLETEGGADAGLIRRLVFQRLA
jgi:hypothetical protein